MCVRVDPCTDSLSCTGNAHFGKTQDNYPHPNQTKRELHSKSISNVVYLHSPTHPYRPTNRHAIPHPLAGFHAHAQFHARCVV